MNISINKKEIEALEYASNRIGGYISDDEEINRENTEMENVITSLLCKIYKAQLKERTRK